MDVSSRTNPDKPSGSMKHLLKIKRKKSPEPPQQSVSGRPADIAAGPPAFQTELDGILNGEGGKMGSQIMFQDAMDTDHASGAQKPGFAIGDVTSYENRSTTGGINDVGREIGRTEILRTAKRARKGSLLEGVGGNTEKFGPLKVVLGGIPPLYANHEKTIVVNNRIENLLSRVVSLEERFNSRPSDVADQRRRDELIRKLDIVGGELRLLSENPGLPQLTDCVQDDDGLFRPLDDLQEAILDYQMAQQTAIRDQEFEQIDPAEAEVLNNVQYAKKAEYRHTDRSGCLKGTRTAILDEINLWTRDFDKPPIYWLNGLAGTGKTTIAQTTAERAFADGKLGASIFCSRDFEDRRDLRSIFPTLAVQLSRRYPEFRSAFVKLVRSDPDVVHEPLYNQMKKLIVQPLAKSTISTVIVIDALDECEDEEPASAILSVLGQFVTEVPKVKFFITGRPESRIQEGFRLPLLAEATDVFVLHEVEPSQVSNDIQLFFRHSFSELKRYRRELDDWPTEEQVDILCERAGGLFVHAMAIVRFIGERNSSPKKQLDRLLQSQGSSAFEGRTRLKNSATLDSLYTSILQGAFGGDHPENDPRVRSVLGAVVLAANPLSPSAIAALLGFESEEVLPLLSSLQSLLILREDTGLPVRPFHKSFPDFIIDQARCTNPRFRVCAPDHHMELLSGCLETMNRELERNMCKLPDGVANCEVIDLKERAEEYIGQALEYACRSWHKHLVGTIPARITTVLHRFLEEKFLFWLEALSILGAVKEAVEALGVLEKCKLTEAQPILDLVRDCSRFLLTFFEVIGMSAPHIYHSALSLSPPTSIISGLYKQHVTPLARIVKGLPLSWELVAATIYLNPSMLIWSPCSKFVAAKTSESVEVFDAATLNRLATFRCPLRHRDSHLSFSPDSRSLTLLAGWKLISWDLQTGGRLSEISPRFRRKSLPQIKSLTYSNDGKMVAVAYKPQRTYRGFEVYAFDLYSRTRLGPLRVPEGQLVAPIWTHDEYLRLAIINEELITIWEVKFTAESFPLPGEVKLSPCPDKVELFSLPDGAKPFRLQDEVEPVPKLFQIPDVQFHIPEALFDFPDEVEPFHFPDEVEPSHFPDEVDPSHLLDEVEPSHLPDEAEPFRVPDGVKPFCFANSAKQFHLADRTNPFCFASCVEQSHLADKFKSLHLLDEVELFPLPYEVGPFPLPDEVEPFPLLDEVESFPLPEVLVGGNHFLLLPALSRLAFTLRNTVQVWDMKASRLLLKSEDMRASYSPPEFSFSSDGRFFAFATTAGEVRIWKESPTGYVLHQRLPSLFDSLEWTRLSPNGRSIIFPLDGTINLCHTGDQILSPPSAPSGQHFTLTFSPDEKTAAFAQFGGNVVTILDLQSCDLRLTINTGMEVECLGVAGDIVVAINHGKIATWNLPSGGHASNANINDSVRTVMLDRSPWLARHSLIFLSLSPDLSHIAVAGESEQGSDFGLEIRDVPTGTCLASNTSDCLSQLWFTRDGREVWMPSRIFGNKGWEIIEDNKSGAVGLKPREETLCPSEAFPWKSSHGYTVTGDGWVLSPTRKRLLWLPHRWRSDEEVHRIWSGQFLGLSHRLSEVVILEFLE